MIALIPARQGSKRVPNKNVRLLGGVPLMCWTISVARKSNVFSKVVVSTDSIEYCQIAASWDAEAILRPKQFAADDSTDFDWIKHALDTIMPGSDQFALLRPTAPFRTTDTLVRAYNCFQQSGADSMRAVELARQHPYKMWVVKGERMFPLFPARDLNVQQIQSMPEIFWQNASLEMAKTRIVYEGSLTGGTIAPFYTSYLEGFDINSEFDWLCAEGIVRAGEVEVPK